MVSIYNSMSDRRHEIAVMRSLGAGRRTVMAVVLTTSYKPYPGKQGAMLERMNQSKGLLEKHGGRARILMNLAGGAGVTAFVISVATETGAAACSPVAAMEAHSGKQGPRLVRLTPAGVTPLEVWDLATFQTTVLQMSF